jgi:hypothetical protein
LSVAILFFGRIALFEVYYPFMGLFFYLLGGLLTYLSLYVLLLFETWAFRIAGGTNSFADENV